MSDFNKVKLRVSEKLLEEFKLSIGDLNDVNPDEYYENFLLQAMSDLIEDDISLDRLNSVLGRSVTILYAEALMNKTDIATNPTITLQKNKLSIATKGDRIGNV